MHILFLRFVGDLICNDCLILVCWMAVCQGCVLWFHLELASSLWGSFSISAFKADHVWEWEMIRDGLMLCCALRKSCLFWHLISTNTNLSGEPQPLPSTESLPMLGFSFKASWEGGGRYLPFYSLLFFFYYLYFFFFLFVLQFEPNPCMLNCHTKSVLLKRRHK